MLYSTLFRLIWSALGIGVGISATLCLVAPPVNPFLLASLGGSSIFLFGMTSAEAAQPRALFAGHLGSALIGIACYRFFGDALWVYALAQAAALTFMLASGSVHPPAGANPMIMIYYHADYSALWQPVFIGVAVLAAVAAAWSRLLPGSPHYPVAWLARSGHPPSPAREARSAAFHDNPDKPPTIDEAAIANPPPNRHLGKPAESAGTRA